MMRRRAGLSFITGDAVYSVQARGRITQRHGDGKREDRGRVYSLTASAAVTSERVLKANRDRTRLVVQNKSGDAVYLAFDEKATASTGLLIPSGGLYEESTHAPKGEIHLVGASGSQEVFVSEAY